MKILNFKFQILNYKKILALRLCEGFTLIELLVVITIIGILSTIGFTTYSAVTKSGRDALRKSNLEQIRSALEIYHAQNLSYPATPVSCGTVPTGLTGAYINYPSDPSQSSGNNYCYVQTLSGSGYQLCAFLENGGAVDPTFCGGQACKSGSGCNYQVQNP